MKILSYLAKKLFRKNEVMVSFNPLNNTLNYKNKEHQKNNINVEKVVIPDIYLGKEIRILDRHVVELFGVKELYINSLIETIDTFFTFNYAENLDSIFVDANNVNYISDGGILYNKSMTELVRFPNAKEVKNLIISEGILSISEYAFSNCKKIDTVTLPRSLKIINSGAFIDSSIKNIIFPQGIDLENIGTGAFQRTQIYTINLLNCTKLNKMGGSMFASCENLCEYTLPDHINFIASFAFASCNSLSSVLIRNNIEKIGSGAFMNCENLKVVEFEKESKITVISDSCFSNTGLTEFIVPNSVEIIGAEAFYRTLKLESVFISKNVTEIGEGAFLNSLKLHEIVCDKGNSKFSSVDGVLYNKTRSRLLVYPYAKSNESFKFLSVTKKINSWAFLNNRFLKSICLTTSKKMDAIEEHAFDGVSNLKNIFIPDSIKYIGESAFVNISGLKIFIEHDSEPEKWDNEWDLGDSTVYWGKTRGL